MLDMLIATVMSLLLDDLNDICVYQFIIYIYIILHFSIMNLDLFFQFKVNTARLFPIVFHGIL